MATCKNCQKSGWFLSVSPDGMCETCAPAVAQEATSVVRVVKESLKIAESTRTLGTLLSRYGVAIDRCSQLLPYERRGIAITDPPPSGVIRDIKSARRDRLLSWVADELAAAHKKSQAATTPAAKIRPFSKLLENMGTIYSSAPDLDDLVSKEAEIRRALDGARLRSELERANKLAFKGQKKRACDAYLDALYILRTDSIPDNEQEGDAAKIEAKIRELGGRVPAS